MYWYACVCGECELWGGYTSWKWVVVYHGFPSLFGKGEVKGGRGDGVMGWMGLLQGYGGGGNLIQYFAT